LPSRVNIDTRCRLFADDCLLYRIIDGLEDQVQLQSDLRELEQWAADWGMQFNPSKCRVLSANKRSHHHHQYFYELCGVVQKSVELSEKYLGVSLSSDLSWSFHITAICTKANQKLGFIKRNLKGTPRELKRLAYVALWGQAWKCQYYMGSSFHQGQWCTGESPEEGCSLDHKQARSGYKRYCSATPGRRRINRLTFLYKILNEHVAVPMSQLDLVLCDRPVRGSTTKQRLKIPRCASTQFQKSFAARTITTWCSTCIYCAITEWNSSPDSMAI